MPPIRNLTDDQLRELIRRATQQGTTEDFRTLVDCFDHIANHPERREELSDAVAEAVARYVSMSGVTGKMLDDKRVGPSDIVGGGIETLETLADQLDESFSDAATLQWLLEAQQTPGIDEVVRSKLISLVGRCHGAPDALIINDVVPALEAAVDDERTWVYRAATRAAGRLIAAGVEPASELVRPLEAAADHGPKRTVFAIVGAGIALTASDPPAARLYDILDQPEATHLPVESTQDKILIKARAKAACYALTAAPAVRGAERELLERFVTHENPAVRSTVPATLNGVYRDGQTIPAKPARELLATALDDEDEDVQEAAVEAAEAAIEAGVEDADAFTALIRQSLNELDGAASRKALEAMDTIADRSQELVEAGIDVDEFETAVREQALFNEDPDIRDAAYGNLDAIDRLRRSATDEDDEDDEDDEPPGDDERSLEERAEEFRESHSPRDFPEQYEKAESTTRDAILKAVEGELSELGHSLEAIEAFKTTLRTAWDDSDDTNEERRQQVLVCVQTGCENNNVGAPLVDEFVERAWQTAVPTLQGNALATLGIAVTAEVYEWNEVSDRVIAALESENPRLIIGALSALTEAVSASDLSMAQHFTYLDKIPRENAAVAAATQMSLRRLVLNDVVSWDDISDRVTDGLAHEAADVVEAAVSVVGASAQAGLVEWAQVGDRLTEALGHEQSAVASEAVKATYAGTSERFDWVEAEPLFRDALAHHDYDVARAAVAHEYLGARLHDGTLSWTEVSDLISEALADPRPGVAGAAVASVRVGLAGDFSWGPADEFLMTALEHDESAVAHEAIKAVGAVVQSGQVEWAAAKSYLRQAVGNHESDISTEACNIVAVGICEGEFEWSQVEGFLRRELVRDEAAQALEAVRAVCFCLANEEIGWEACVPMLQTVLLRTDPEIAKLAIQGVGEAVDDRPTDWTDVEKLVDLGLAHDASEVNELTVRIAGAGLGAGRFAWADVSTFLRGLLTDGWPELAAEAVRAVRHAVQQEQLAWDEVGEFLTDALDGHSEAAWLAVETVKNGVDSRQFAWTDVVAFLERAVADTDDGVATASLETVAAAINNQSPSPATVEPVVRRALAEGSDDVARSAVEMAATAVYDPDIQVEYGQFGDLFTHAFEAGITAPVRPSVVRYALSGATVGVRDGQLEWATVEPRLDRALAETTDSAVLVAAAEIIRIGLGSDETDLDWEHPQVSQWLTDIITHDNSAAARDALGCILVAVSRNGVQWNQIQGLLTTSLEHRDNEVRTAAVVLVGKLVEAGDVPWAEAAGFYEEVVRSQPSEVVRGVISLLYDTLIEDLSWSAVENVLTCVFDQQDTEVVCAAITLVRSQLLASPSDWADALTFVRRAAESDDPDVARAGIQSLAAAVVAGLCTWDDVEHHFSPPYEDPEVAHDALPAVYTLVQAEVIDREVIIRLISTLLACDAPDVESEVVQEALQAAGACLHEFEWFGWADVSEAVVARFETRTPEEAATAVRATLSGVAGETAWREVADFVTEAFDEGSSDVRLTILDGIQYLIEEHDLPWSAAEPFVDDAIARDDIGDDIVRAVVLLSTSGLEAEACEWVDVVDYLAQAREDRPPTQVIEATLAAANRALVHDSTINWSDVAPFVSTALESGDGDVARSAFQVLETGLEQGRLTWEDARSHIASALTCDTTVAAEAIDFVCYAERRDDVPSTNLDLVLQHGYSGHPPSVRQKILAYIGNLEAHDGLLTDHQKFLRALPDEPHSGLLVFALSEVVSPSLVRGVEHEDILFAVLRDILEGTTDPQAQTFAVRALGRGLSVTDADGRWRSLLESVALDDSYHSSPRRAALRALTSETDLSATGSEFVSMLECLVTNDDVDGLRAEAMRTAGEALVESDLERGDAPDVHARLDDLLRDGLIDSDEVVKQAAARSIAQVNRQSEFTATSHQLEALRQVIVAGDLSPVVQLELTDILAQLDEPAQFTPPAARAGQAD
jgi:hypothetical protein